MLNLTCMWNQGGFPNLPVGFNLSFSSDCYYSPLKCNGGKNNTAASYNSKMACTA